MFGHQKNVWRFALLLGLVALFVVMGGDAWAEYVLSEQVPNTFPYLSPDLTQRNMLINAYILQMRLFSSIGGSGDGLKTLYYLGLTGCMVGALLAIFNPKYRKPIIMASWLLLVVIVIFQPLGSKLLFYQVDVGAVKDSSGADISDTFGQTFESCTKTPDRCGFAPQLAAIHVAATMQLTMSDLFRSLDWNGIVEKFSADQANSTAKFLVMPSTIYPAKIEEYTRSCGFNMKQLADKMQTGATDDATSTRGPPYLLGQEWADIMKIYNDDLDPANASPPKAIRLYDGAEYKTLAEPHGWTSANKRAYERALTGIYRHFTDNLNKDVAIDIPAGCENCITADQAMHELDEVGFFNPIDEGALGTGFFFTWAKSVNYKDNPSIAFGGGGGTDLPEHVTPQLMRMCYTPTKDEEASNALFYQKNLFCNKPEVMVDKQAKFIRNNLKNVPDRGSLPLSWQKLDTFLRTPDQSSLPMMPVGRVEYPIAVFATQQGDENSQNGVKFSNPTVYDSDGIGCIQKGKDLIKTVIDQTFSEGGSADNFKKLNALLTDPATTVRIPEQLQRTDIIDSAEDVERAGTNQLVSNILKSLNGSLKLAAQGRVLSDAERQTVLRAEIVSFIDKSSKRAYEEQNKGNNNAATDATKTDVVGSNLLTYIGGGAAKFLGELLVNVGAAFMGPLAAAVVYFISLLVDFAMMLIIVLTPFLFLAGLFIPTVALGVLTVAVLGAFLLKFVPVTLIILNNLAMMLYNFIGAAAGDKDSTMQSILIIAMSGLYMNLVGLTFFLIFKLGDPSAILGRLTALDGSAKQMGESGIRAAKALAATAATIGAAALTGGAAAGFGRMALMAKAGAKAAGVPSDVLDGLQAAGSSVMKQAPAAETAGDPILSDEAAEKALMDEVNGVKAVMDDSAAGMDAVKNSRMKDSRGENILSEALRTKDTDGKQLFSKDEANQLLRDGRLVKEHADGSFKEYSYNPDLSSAGAWTMNEPRSITGGRAAESLTGNQFNVNPDDLNAAPVSAAEVPMSADDKIQSMLAAKAQQDAAGGQLVDANGKPIAGAAAVAGAGAATSATAVSSAAATAQGTPLQVSVVGGELNKIGEVQGLNEAMAANNDMKSRMQQKEKDDLVDNLSSDKKATGDLAAKIEDKKVSDELRSLDFDNVQSEPERQQMLAQRDAILKKAGTTVGAQQAKASYRRNMNDQVAQELANVEQELKTVNSTSPRKKELEDLHKLLLNTDTAALTQGELMQRMGTMESMKESMALRGAADNLPGLGRSIWSGIYGGVSGVGGGIARIPVVGHAISEALNEYYQAPERARAMNSVGGFMNWRAAQKDAQRLGFYQKEMSPIAAGHQYNSMVAVGGFQAQADLARQAASEAVAKSRSQFEAMAAHTKDHGKNVLTQNFMTANDLAGLGRLEAADRVTSVRQEAYLMQGAPLTVQRAVRVDEKGVVLRDSSGKAISALDNNMNLITDNGKPVAFKVEEANVVLTAESMNKIRGDLSTKRQTKTFDEMMITHYGLAEKQYLRGDAEWNAARNMTRGAAAASAFSRKDISTDYLIGGHMNMVQGKERFLEGKGQYEKLVEFRNETNKLVNTQVAQMLGSVAGNIQEALKKFEVDPGKFNFSTGGAMMGQDLAVQQKLQLEKKASEQLKKDGVYVPLNAIFDEAGTSGSAKYMQRAEMAFYNQANQEAIRLEKVSKAAGDYMRSKMPNLRDLDKGFNLESDGRRVKFDKAGDVLARSVMEMLSTEVVKGLNFSNHSQKGIDIMREIIAAEDKAGRESLIVGSEKKDGKIQKTWTSISNNVMDKWTERMAEIDNRMTGQIAAFENKQYKKVGSRIDLASYERSLDGKEDKIFNEST